MDIKRFYIGYFITLLLIIALAAFKYTFLEVMAILGTALTGTSIIMFIGYILYRTYILLSTPKPPKQ